MTTRDKIYAALVAHQELTAQEASALTGFSITTCRSVFNRMIAESLIDTRSDPVLRGGYTLTYLSRESTPQGDLADMRAMMITKAWAPGELRL